MGAHDSPLKYLQVACIPDSLSSTNVTSPRSENNNTSLSSKMKRMLSSPKVTRGKAAPSPNKTFGVPLEFLNERDKCDVPLIVTRICEFLKSNGLRQEGLFRVNGNMKVVDRLKNAFDKCGDADLEEIGDVPAAASLLKMFLREMTDPVIPEQLQPIFIQVQDQYCKEKEKAIPLFKQLIQRLPPSNAYLLKYLCEFMLTIADGSDVNKMTPLALAIVFGPNIFRCGEGLEGLRDQAYVNAVLLLILQEYEEMFLIDNDMFKESKPRSAPEKPAVYFDSKKIKTDLDSSSTIPSVPMNLTTPSPDSEQSINKDRSPRRTQSAKSPRRNITRKSTRQDSLKSNRNNLKRRGQKEPERSGSPSYNGQSSPLSKHLVNTTINSAVKEHLFGPDLMMSSTDSESLEKTQENSLGENDEAELTVYPSVKDRVKKFSVGTEPPTFTTPNKKHKPITSKTSIKKTQGQTTEMTASITDKDLDYIRSTSQKPLDSLTHSRAPSQKRRPPSIIRRNRDSIISEENHDTRRSAGEDGTIYTDSKTAFKQQLQQRLSNGVGGLNKTPTTTGKKKTDKQRPNVKPSDDATTSFERLNIIELQGQEQDSDVQRSSRSFIRASSTNDEETLAFHSAPSSPGENRKMKLSEKMQDSVPIVEMSPTDLKKRIFYLKKTISNFENEFTERHGRKPKASEKGPIQKYIAELGRAKKQHKELLNDYKESPHLLMDTAPLGPDLGTAPNLKDIIDRDAEPTKEQTLNNILKRLEEKRAVAGRPHEILAMSNEQLKEEKLAVQKALLQYENLHGRPSTKDDKALMRPIYDRYRKIKRLIAAYKENVSDDTIYSPRKQIGEMKREISRDTAGTPENMGEANAHFAGDDSMLPGDTFSVTNRLPYTPEPFSPTPIDSIQTFDESILQNASLNELIEQLKETKNAKKRLGKTLKDFEDDFFVTNDRKVQKEDRMPREAEYREYKLIKAKMRLLEALIAKKKTNEAT